MTVTKSEQLKRAVHDHWSSEPCGTRGVSPEDRRRYFEQITRERYEFEPHLQGFADFESARGKRVLEIGVGAGTDFMGWVRAGAIATGVDLTEAAIELTRERLVLDGLDAELQTADAENLPFDDGSFDIVYSYGVLHHTPDTRKAVAEARRVLKPGGTLKLMLYHHPSMTALLLWGVHCVARLKPWRTPRRAVYEHLESPGTKCYTMRELRDLVDGMTVCRLEVVFMSGDLLRSRPAEKYGSTLAGLAWRFYPRWLIRRVGRRLGLGALIEAVKPA